MYMYVQHSRIEIHSLNSYKLKQQYEVYIYMHRVMIGGQIHLVTGYKMHIQFHPKVTWTYTIGHFKSQLFD